MVYFRTLCDRILLMFAIPRSNCPSRLQSLFYSMQMIKSSGFLYNSGNKFQLMLVFLDELHLLRVAKVLFVSIFSETFPRRYSTPGVLLYSLWLYGSWFLIKVTLNWEKSWSTKSPYGTNFVLFQFKTARISFFPSLNE